MTPSKIVNIIEIGLWFSFGIIFLIQTVKNQPRRTRLLILSLAFFAFSLSDYIEIQTGAWWTPLSLLFLKATCVAIFANNLHFHIKHSKK
jgi:hypothetical protein